MKPKAATRGKTLRQQTHQYILEHQADFRNLWTKDPNWTTTTEDGVIPIPDNWDDWLKALLRPGRRLCQHTLRAAACRLGVRVVVVRGGGSGLWEEPIAVGSPKHLTEPIVVSLRDERYRLIRAKPGFICLKSGLKHCQSAICLRRLLCVVEVARRPVDRLRMRGCPQSLIRPPRVELSLLTGCRRHRRSLGVPNLGCLLLLRLEASTVNVTSPQMCRLRPAANDCAGSQKTSHWCLRVKV